ncbi:MAG: hypothetical protein HY690_10305 [Chloroflexi bacterium]|nr:hypothetical protein [Chloroflexota bacterium]
MVQLSPPHVRQDRPQRELESLLLLASAVLWGALALTVWQERRAETRRKVQEVSSRLLRQVFPNGLPH